MPEGVDGNKENNTLILYDHSLNESTNNKIIPQKPELQERAIQWIEGTNKPNLHEAHQLSPKMPSNEDIALQKALELSMYEQNQKPQGFRQHVEDSEEEHKEMEREESNHADELQRIYY